MGLSAINASRSGMMAAERRLEVAASNIANMKSAGSAPDEAGRSSAYRPLDLRQTSLGNGAVGTAMVPRANGVEVQYDPDHPEANALGQVGAPSVDLASELVDVLQARIGYAASAKVMKVADGMMRTATDMLA